MFCFKLLWPAVIGIIIPDAFCLLLLLASAVGSSNRYYCCFNLIDAGWDWLCPWYLFVFVPLFLVLLDICRMSSFLSIH